MLSTTDTDSPDTQRGTNLDWALKYAQMGLRVFPLQAGTKVPMTMHGVKDATDDPLIIKDWWTKAPDAGIGLAARAEKIGDPCFLEFDQKPTLKDWAKNEGQPIPETRVHRSGGKGAPHFVFTHTEKSLALGNCDGSTAGREWFSFRAANRYIVAPPSIHPDSGKPYTVFADMQPTPIPDWLVERIRVNGTREKDASTGLRPVHEDFDFDSFAEWVGGVEDADGSWFPFRECPVVGRRHMGQGAKGCALFFDGESLGFKCMAAECPSNMDRKPGQGGISFLVSFLSKEHGAYEGVIWHEREDQMSAMDADLAEKLIDAIGGDEPVITDGGVCTKKECKSGHYRSEASTLCHDCADPEPTPTPQVTIDYLRRNSEAAFAAAAAMAPKPEEVKEIEPAALPDYKAPKPMYPMPEECIYGWIGDFCRTLNCPLQVAYPMALAFFAGNGIPFSNNVRTNLNVCVVGPRGWGKTRTFQRIRDSFAYSVPTQIIQKYPGRA